MSTPFQEPDKFRWDPYWEYEGSTDAQSVSNASSTMSFTYTGSTFSTIDLSVFHHWKCCFCGYRVTTFGLRPIVPSYTCVCLNIPEIMES